MKGIARHGAIRRAACLSAVLATSVILGAAIARGEVFVNPPETDPLIPPGGWVTPFPYPRNILIGFGTDPAAWPDDPVEGKKDLLPGVNCIHQGWDDARLHESDWGSWFGEDYDWIDTDDRFPNRQGLVGIDGRTGVSLVATLHLDNEPDPRLVKHLWIEFEYYLEGGGWEAETLPEGGSTVTDFESRDDPIGDGWWRRNFWIEVEPNPPWEDLEIEIWTFSSEPAAVLFDYLHVATECVPEPATLGLLALGAAGMALGRRRRRGR